MPTIKFDTTTVLRDKVYFAGEADISEAEANLLAQTEKQESQSAKSEQPTKKDKK